MTKYIEYLLKQNKIKEIIKSIEQKDSFEIGEADKKLASLVSLLTREALNTNIVVVTPNTYQAQKIFDELQEVDDNTFFYPKDDFIATELLSESYEFKLERVNTLKNILINNNLKIIITPIQTLLSKIPKKEDYESKIIKLNVGLEIKTKKLIDLLSDSGYKRCYTVEKQGEYSLRGEILDIFPINENKAFRILFDFDQIESIKEFDLENQRSKENKESIIVMPKDEIFFSEEQKDIIRFYINEKIEADLDDKTKNKYLEDLENLDIKHEYMSLQKYLSIFINENYSLLDYIENKRIIFYDIDAIFKQQTTTQEQINDYLSEYRSYFNDQAFLNDFYLEDYINIQ